MSPRAELNDERGASVDDCVFCRIVRGEAPSWRVLEDDATLAFFDVNPVSAFHTLVVPKAHHSDAFTLPAAAFLDVMRTVKAVLDLYAARLSMRDVQLVSSSGAGAQQDVFHAHVHVVPRFHGDGQDVRWTVHPELREQFDELLARLR